MPSKPKFDKNVLNAVDRLLKNGVISQTTKGKGKTRINVIREVSIILQNIHSLGIDIDRVVDYIINFKTQMKRAPRASVLIKKHDAAKPSRIIGSSTEAKKEIEKLIGFADKKTTADFLRGQQVQARIRHAQLDKAHRDTVGPSTKIPKGGSHRR